MRTHSSYGGEALSREVRKARLMEARLCLDKCLARHEGATWSHARFLLAAAMGRNGSNTQSKVTMALPFAHASGRAPKGPMWHGGSLLTRRIPPHRRSSKANSGTSLQGPRRRHFSHSGILGSGRTPQSWKSRPLPPPTTQPSP